MAPIVGIIGGSGFDDPDFLKEARTVKLASPYGPLSHDPFVGYVAGVETVMILRHGKGHRVSPSAVNYRSHIWALKELGVTHVIATTACGSLREHIAPGTLVFPDQFIDMTRGRKGTFFDGDQVAHISMADPFCECLRRLLIAAALECNIAHTPTGAVVTIEGPRFSTRAESKMFRLLGGDIINMSTCPEAALAREAGLCYAAAAMSTDYDCWHTSEEPVTWEMISQVMSRNVESVKRVFFNVLPKIVDDDCACKDAIKTALV